MERALACSAAMCTPYWLHVAGARTMSIPLVESVGRKLGGAEVVGHDVRSQADLASVVRARLPLRSAREPRQKRVRRFEIETLIIPERTRRHRAQKGQPLTVEESDRVVRLLRIQTLAEETFGSPDKAAGTAAASARRTRRRGAPLRRADRSGRPRHRDHSRPDRLGRRCLMQLWRLSGAAHARAFDGGYGLLYPGRWNSAGRAVTYCATSPSLCVLEKLVHVEDPGAASGTA